MPKVEKETVHNDNTNDARTGIEQELCCFYFLDRYYLCDYADDGHDEQLETNGAIKVEFLNKEIGNWIGFHRTFDLKKKPMRHENVQTIDQDKDRCLVL